MRSKKEPPDKLRLSVLKFLRGEPADAETIAKVELKIAGWKAEISKARATIRARLASKGKRIDDNP